MLNSMTGFARETAETQFGTMTCEMRAVNHRFLDIQFRLPEGLRSKETELRNHIGASVRRGKVECALYLKKSSTTGAELHVNEALVEQLAARACEISRILPETHALDPIDVLRWPGIVAEPEIDTEPLFEVTATLVGKTLRALENMRANEGKRISGMIESRLEDILSIASTVRERIPDVLDAVRARQKERIDKLDVEADPARLETELALIAQKLDVDEELDRLESHVSEARTAMDSDEPVGRRLDFLMQELNREANTLGSKSADTETTSATIELKVLIEQMREQIQNVE